MIENQSEMKFQIIFSNNAKEYKMIVIYLEDFDIIHEIITIYSLLSNDISK